MHTSKVVLIGILTFVLGLLAGLSFALYRHKQDEAFIISLLESRQVDTPHDVAFQLKTISAAQAGDTAWIIRRNCVRARSRVPLIDPSVYAEAKRIDVTNLIERSRSKIQELERNDLCSVSD